MKEKFTCKYCSEVYKEPVSLNCCGENICKKHIKDLISTSLSNKFTCPMCNEENSNQKLNVNKLIQDLLRNDLHKFEIDSKYKSTLNNFETEIRNLEAILNEPENYIYEEISDLKRQVDLDRERLKGQIDNLADNLIQNLELYEKKFKIEIKSKVDLDKFKNLITSSKEQLKDFEMCLSLFSVKNEERDKKKKEVDTSIKVLQPKAKEIKEMLFSNTKIMYKPMERSIEDFLGKLVIKVS